MLAMLYYYEILLVEKSRTRIPLSGEIGDPDCFLDATRRTKHAPHPQSR